MGKGMERVEDGTLGAIGGAIYLVMFWGNGRQSIFDDERDRERMLRGWGRLHGISEPRSAVTCV